MLPPDNTPLAVGDGFGVVSSGSQPSPTTRDGGGGGVAVRPPPPNGPPLPPHSGSSGIVQVLSTGGGGSWASSGIEHMNGNNNHPHNGFTVTPTAHPTLVAFGASSPGVAPPWAAATTAASTLPPLVTPPRFGVPALVEGGSALTPARPRSSNSLPPPRADRKHDEVS